MKLTKDARGATIYMGQKLIMSVIVLYRKERTMDWFWIRAFVHGWSVMGAVDVVDEPASASQVPCHLHCCIVSFPQLLLLYGTKVPSLMSSTP